MTTSKQTQNNITSGVRPPIVVVMGHVDHGKSTLLDYIRHANTVDKEFGGITQHVAAYEVVHKYEGIDKRITFIDTPGHAAFGAIRARGANIADIAILVVAADDGVKAQTLEALSAIRSSNIPFIVAINKTDKPNADIARTQNSLAEQGVYLETLGGDVPWVAISAKKGTGIPELLDLILIVSEIADYKGTLSLPGSGFVIEAHRDQKRGIAATLIITDGTIETGMSVVAGSAIAPVRLMESHTGTTLKQASFSSPVVLVGFDELPAVGEIFTSYANKREAEKAREIYVQENHASQTQAAHQEDGFFTLPIILRADATGSLEALVQEIHKLGDEKHGVTVVQSGIGTISENDIRAALAGTAPALVVGFNVGIDTVAEAIARERGVEVEFYNIIYKLTETLTERLKKAKPKEDVIEVLGRAKVLMQFSSHKLDHVLGIKVLEGQLVKNGTVRVSRRADVLGNGVIINIQANKQNVDRIDADRECGAHIEANFEIMQGDTIEYIVTTRQ
ncbi:MAG: infB [Candidatus Kaiserbacteria bacterium]|nr:infB [Candidatus Kaiserbacteria bacterium]